MLSVANKPYILSANMLDVVMLTAIMLSVVAPIIDACMQAALIERPLVVLRHSAKRHSA
jgi:hypothetical protein